MGFPYIDLPEANWKSGDPDFIMVTLCNMILTGSFPYFDSSLILPCDIPFLGYFSLVQPLTGTTTPSTTRNRVSTPPPSPRSPWTVGWTQPGAIASAVVTMGFNTSCGSSMTTGAGWWYTYPSEKYDFVSWDDDYSQYMDSHKSHVPNHQPVKYL